MKNTIEIVKIILLGVIAVCSIILVTQGYGGGTQDVYVRGGEIEVEGYVDIGGKFADFGPCEAVWADPLLVKLS